MDVEIATILQYTGPAWTPHGVTRTTDGTLYAIVGAHANWWLDQKPTGVYVSTDNGYTWAKDVEWVQVGRRAGNHGECYAHIAVDGLDTVHVAWGSWAQLNGRHGYLSYATKPKGGSWSGVTDLCDYVGDNSASSQNAVLSIVIDGLNQVHILYLVADYVPVEWVYWSEHHWYDGSWHKETVYGGWWNDISMLAVDPDNTIYQLYYDLNDPYTAHLGKKPLGGSWSTEVIPEITGVPRFCCDKDGNLHFIALNQQYKKRNSDESWEPAETYSAVYMIMPTISVTQDGIVHLACRRANPVWKYHHFQRSLLGVWTATELTYYGSEQVGGQGSPLLHAIFPVSQGYYPCLLEDGYAFSYKTGNYYFRFAADPVIPAPPSAGLGGNLAEKLVKNALI